MKKIVSIILIILCILTVSACNYEYIKKDKYIMADEAITKIIEISDFEERLKLPYNLQGSFSLSLTKNDVEKTIGIECLRDNEKCEYSTHKVRFDNGDICYCFISYQSERVVDTWFVSTIPNKKQFMSIKQDETTFDEIRSLDPAAIIFYADEPVSYHRFKDGTMMEIVYNKVGDKFIVKEYGIEDDPVNIVKNLITSDLELIT